MNRKAEEIERRLRECEMEKNRLEKELKEAKQNNTKTTKTLKDLRLDVNVMLRNILNEVSENYYLKGGGWYGFKLAQDFGDF